MRVVSLDSFKLFSQLEPSKVAVSDIGHHTDTGDRSGEGRMGGEREEGVGERRGWGGRDISRSCDARREIGIERWRYRNTE